MKNDILEELSNKGYLIKDPWDAVTLFENKLAEYGGSKYAVCVDSCSNAIFLCLKYLGISNQIIEIPKNTYASVPMQCIHAGNKIKFIDLEWHGYYNLGGTPIVDSATRFNKNMYKDNTYHCLSFHHRKTLQIGRGGAILCNDEDFVKWARPMIYDGRNKSCSYAEDDFECIGFHMYMTPEDAALGILKFDQLPEFNEDTGSSLTYKDLSIQEIFKLHLI